MTDDDTLWRTSRTRGVHDTSNSLGFRKARLEEIFRLFLANGANLVEGKNTDALTSIANFVEDFRGWLAGVDN